MVDLLTRQYFLCLPSDINTHTSDLALRAACLVICVTSGVPAGAADCSLSRHLLCGQASSSRKREPELYRKGAVLWSRLINFNQAQIVDVATCSALSWRCSIHTLGVIVASLGTADEMWLVLHQAQIYDSCSARVSLLYEITGQKLG